MAEVELDVLEAWRAMGRGAAAVVLGAAARLRPRGRSRGRRFAIVCRLEAQHFPLYTIRRQTDRRRRGKAVVKPEG